MSEPNDSRESTANESVAMPWQVLLTSIGQSAAVVVDEVSGDLVLGESVTTSVSAYLTQRYKLAVLRKEFAEADILCGELRKQAQELMRSFGYDFAWNQDDLGAVDSQLAANMQVATENAAAINKQRAAASLLTHQMLERAIDEISLCASIAVLRQVERYSSEGEAFCVAFAATALLRERTIDDMPLHKAMDALSDWMQYSIGVKARMVEFDIYAHSRIAAAIGKNMAIDNTAALRLALIDAMKKFGGKKPD